MNYKTKITGVKKDFSLADNKPFLDVSFDILDEKGSVVGERRLAFEYPEEGKAKETESKIEEVVARYAIMFTEDNKLAAEAEERSQAEKAADEVIKNFN